MSLNNKKRGIVYAFSKTESPIALGLIPLRGEILVALKSSNKTTINKLVMKNETLLQHVQEISPDSDINLVVDEVNQKLYWSDSKNKRIMVSDYDGTKIKTFRTTPKKVSSMAIIGGEICWTSYMSKFLMWGRYGNKILLQAPPEENLPKLIAVIASGALKAEQHECLVDNGGCPDICISDGLFKRNCLEAIKVIDEESNTVADSIQFQMKKPEA